MIEASWQTWATFAVIVLAVAVYAWDRLPMELTSLGTLAVLLLVFQLGPAVADPNAATIGVRELLAGFAEPALIAVLGLMVVGQGLIRTGALEGLARRLVEDSKLSGAVAFALMLAAVGLISAVINNTPVVVIFIPIMLVLAERAGHSVSLYMIPLSFVAILGGMMTLIGSSTNLLVAGSYGGLSGRQIGFFDFVVPGAVLALIGYVYLVLVAPRLLIDRASMANELVGGEGKQFIAQIEVRPGSRLIGTTTVAGMIPGLNDMTVRLIQRGEHAFLPPFDEVTLAPRDEIVVAATRNALAKALSATPELLPDGATPEDFGRDQVLAEVVVAPASRMIGRDLQQIGFHYQTHCTVLGIQRRSRMIRAAMNEIRLEAGDVLLILGSRIDVTALRANRDVLLLEWSAHDMPARSHVRRARLIFVAVVVAAAFDILPIAAAAVCGAAAMIASGCLNVHQAARAIDRRIVLLIGSALAMGAALKGTGGAELVGGLLVAVAADWGPAAVLAALFGVVAVFTNILSNNATAVLFTPVAVSTAAQLGTDPLPFVYGVLFAANCSFATPMGYQTNLLVMGPGRYRFIDFVRVGGPLILLIWLAYAALAPWYYGLI